MDNRVTSFKYNSLIPRPIFSFSVCNIEKLGMGLARVYKTEEKRVSNALYTPCKMFSESHAPGIQTLTNENARFKQLIMGVASSVSKHEHNSD